MKMWVKFSQDYVSKGKIEGEETSFKKGNVYEIDEIIAKSLIDLGLSERTDEPKIDNIIEKTRNEYFQGMQDTVEESVIKAFKGIGEGTMTIPAVAVDHELEKMHGFESEAHFSEAVVKAGRETNPVVDERLLQKAPSGQNTLDDAEGGFLIPETISNRILIQNRDAEEIDFFGMAGDKQTTSGNNMRVKRRTETSRKDGFGRHGDMVSYWKGEADQFEKSVITWDEHTLELHKLTALAYVTDEQMEDSFVNMGSQFTTLARQAIFWKRNQAMFTGTGAGMPLGFHNAPATILVLEKSGQANGTILHENIVNMYHAMLPEMRGSAVWYAHDNVIKLLQYVNFNDEATSNAIHPVYLPPGGISNSPYGSLMGRPVVPTEFCPDLGSSGDINFVNFAAYSTLVKQGRGAGVSRASSIHVRFLFGETAFRFHYRCDARPLWKGPIEDLNGTTKRSPFVMLEERVS